VRRPTFGNLVLGAIATAAVLAITALAAAAPNVTVALEVQRRLTTDHPQDASAWNDLGNLLVLADKQQEAAAAYAKAVEIDPKKVSALFNIGLLAQQQGRVKEAMESYKRVLDIDPSHAWTHFQIGLIQERKGSRDKAIESYSRAFSADSQLALPEVNPQVVESRLTTEAMLRAYQRGMAKEPVRHQYEDPSRIARLLMQEKSAEEAKNTTPDTSKAPTVLTAGNLPPGKNVGQIQPANGSGKGSRSNNPASASPLQQSNLGPSSASNSSVNGQTWQRPVPKYTNPSGSGDVTGGTVPGYVINNPTSSYRPGIASTGQMTTSVIPPR
jgi:tetratricopeptide (TPR) repeat protein